MNSDLQGLILETGRDSGILTAEAVRSAQAQSTGSSPLLKDLIDRQGFGQAEIERLLERFWAQNGSRRGLLHRDAEDRIVVAELVRGGKLSEAQVREGIKERDERQMGGDRVRLLSVLIDAGAVPQDAGRAALDTVRQQFKFCRYCLSSFQGTASERCDVCGRPLSPVARAYEITELSTIAADTAPEGVGAMGASVAEPPPVGASVAGVKLLEKIDREGRGVIYRGQRVGDSQARAVKVWQISEDITADDVVRFGSEALQSARLEHESIVRVFEAGEENGVHFVIAEWVEGKTLHEYVASRGPMAPKVAAEAILKVVAALEAAHASKVLHKNVAPQNIFVCNDGAVKIADFGECGDYGIAADRVSTSMIGSPAYLAPEQCDGLRADVRTDIYSLGLTFYYALSGKEPFTGDTPVAVAVKRLTADPTPIRQVAKKVPKALAHIVERMTQRKPDKRYATIAEVKEAILAYRYPPPTFLQKHGKKVAAAVAAVLIVGGGIEYGWYHYSHLPTDPQALAMLHTVDTLVKECEFERAERQLSKAEGIYGEFPEAAEACARLVEGGLAFAEERARAKDYEPALKALEAVKAAARSPELKKRARTKLAELEKRASSYLARAKKRFYSLESSLEGRPDPEVAEAMLAFARRFPHTEWAERAQARGDAASKRTEKAGTVAAVEVRLHKLMPQDASLSATLVEVRRQLTAVSPDALSAEERARFDRVRADLELLEKMRDALELAREGRWDEGMEQLQAYSQQAPGDVRVRRALAEARFLKLQAKAKADDHAQDPEAVVTYRKALEQAELCGIEATEIRARIAALESSGRGQESVRARADRLIEEGDRLARNERWKEAYRKYLEAKSVAPPTSALAQKMRVAAERAGLDAEGRAYLELQAKLDATAKNAAKRDLLSAFLRRYPASSHRKGLRAELARLGGAAGGTAAASAAALPSGLVPAVERGFAVSERDGAPMVLVPAGTFVQGSTDAEIQGVAKRWGIDPAKLRPETPARKVKLRAFYIDVFEVTNAQYQAFLRALEALPNAHKYCHPSEPAGKSHIPKYAAVRHWSQPELPVVGVDWFDAYAYARWAQKRLPTEAEWERAARGRDHRQFPWGDDPGVARSCSAEAWAGLRFSSLADWRSRFVAKKPWKGRALTVSAVGFPGDVSPVGARHMAGNVWEWCEDWYAADAYRTLGRENPVQGEPHGKSRERVVRGGAWIDPLLYHRTTARRQSFVPTKRNLYLGFRCARDPS